VTDLSGPLANSVLRLVRLLDTPVAIPILYPAIMREICYWILTGRHAGEIMRLTMAKTYESTVIRAIHALRRGFAKAIRIHELAAMAKMSPTAFHRHFKSMTSMTPLQYQKQLRLIEARRLMLSEALNVESAAFKVGYESPFQFTREYTRLFGAAPRRDITAMRLAAN
jgi:transcriptional regulator GlxA family with amidase domain